MDLRTYRIRIDGIQPLLMHSDDIEWSDQMDAWKLNIDNKKNSKAGDDRYPAWRWIGSLYNDGENIIIPMDNLMRCLMEAGKQVPTGKGTATFKSQTQSGIMPNSIGWPILIEGRPVSIKPIIKMIGNKNFDDHKELAIKSGFDLFLKRAKIGASKHVRVRPRFSRWSAEGDLTVSDDAITTAVLQNILEHAGKYKGLGDWRPGGKTPGSWGMFNATATLVK